MTHPKTYTRAILIFFAALFFTRNRFQERQLVQTIQAESKRRGIFSAGRGRQLHHAHERTLFRRQSFCRDFS